MLTRERISVRPMADGEGETLARLIDALADYEKLARPDAEARRRLLAHASDSQPYFHVLLAEHDGEVCGYALYFFTYSTFLARPTLYVEDIFVLEHKRRHGLGLALMKAMAQQALARECGRMEWQVLDWNAPAKRFYDSLGAELLETWEPCRLTMPGIARLAE